MLKDVLWCQVGDERSKLLRGVFTVEKPHQTTFPVHKLTGDTCAVTQPLKSAPTGTYSPLSLIGESVERQSRLGNCIRG